jgi:hypothetical protein
MIRKLNEELEVSDYIVLFGKIPRAFLEKNSLDIRMQCRRRREEREECQHIRMKSKILGTVNSITRIGRETKRKKEARF